MRSNGDIDWYCAECLRAINRGHIVVDANDRGPYTLSAWDLMDVLTKYGSKSLKTVDGFQRIPLWAATMVNGEFRCWAHLER